MESSHEFFVAVAGAAAALAGLIIVAMTVSVDRIIAIPGMTSRAATAIGLLVGVTIIALAGLIDQPRWVFGVEAIVASLAVIALAVDSMVRVIRSPGPSSRAAAVVKTLAGLVPGVLLLGGSLVVLTGGTSAPVLLGVGTLSAIVVSVLNAWVLLVEIKR